MFVPLCGKSLDMIWLAEQGYEVIGVELSPIAVKAFFNENHLRPVKRQLCDFTLWQHGNISILCGDYFSLTKGHLGHIDIVYDRAALTALPEHETQRQALHVDEEVKSLYSGGFEINLAHVDSVLELNSESPNQTQIATHYKVYILSGR